jgi:large subunit ribosomal protein L15
MRGGKGKAGGRKHFWIRTVKYEPDRYRKKGFKPPSALKPTLETVNVGEIRGLIVNSVGDTGLEEVTEFDLTAIGVEKLLGRGKIDIPLKIRVSSYSSKALEKIQKAGGSIIE